MVSLSNHAGSAVSALYVVSEHARKAEQTFSSADRASRARSRSAGSNETLPSSHGCQAGSMINPPDPPET